MNRLNIDGCSAITLTMAIFILAIACVLVRPASASDADSAIDTIIAGVEARYNVPGFKADFEQESILKAMAVTDTASGRLMVRQPGKMRWEYLVPEPQTIITDGNDLWVFRPEDNQVMVGKAPALFGEGKGAGFLSNIKMVRESFQIFLKNRWTKPNLYRLKLVPNQSSADLMEILWILKKRTSTWSRLPPLTSTGMKRASN
jgi:outer membrane lipoprotein carrier protein